MITVTFPLPVTLLALHVKSPTLERLRRMCEAEKERSHPVSTAGSYAITKYEDFYFRSLSASIKVGWVKPKFG